MTWQPDRSYRETARRRGTSDLRGVDLADVHPAPRRRRPRWDAPVNDPTPLVFVVTVVAILLGIGGWFGALELVARWGG